MTGMPFLVTQNKAGSINLQVMKENQMQHEKGNATYALELMVHEPLLQNALALICVLYYVVYCANQSGVTKVGVLIAGVILSTCNFYFGFCIAFDLL